MGFESAKTAEQVLKEIHSREYLMPAIQREFVWNTDDIAMLFDSLLRGYPVGSFLFWKVEPRTADGYVFYNFLTDYHEKDHPYAERGQVPSGSGTTAVLDGQQRLTSLNIGLYGSHATKRLWARSANTNAYLVKKLYLNLVDSPPEEDLGLQYDLRFLTKEEAAAPQSGAHKWFLVGDVLKLDDDPVAYMDVAQGRNIEDVREAVRRLVNLYSAIRKTPAMNYFIVEDQDPNKVLEIFIRVNSGGQKLTNSDLLLSMATNQWDSEPGAREEVRSLVSDMNELGFNFDKDFVLKSALAMVGADLRFKLSNFTSTNMKAIESNWTRIRNALLITVELFRQSGFSSSTLTARNVALPVAFYLYKLGATDSFLTSTSPAVEADRKAIIRWATRTLLKQGVWGSGVDTLLTRLRGAIDREGVTGGFPVAALESELAALGKALTFDDDELARLLDLRYKGAETFGVLALLYPGLDFSKQFHEDHIFPKSLFTKELVKSHAIPQEKLNDYLEAFNLIPNLQLLEGTANQEKLAKLPADWIANNLSDARRANYLAENDIDDIDLDLSNFLQFFSVRRERLRQRLIHALGMTSVITESSGR